MDGAAASLLDDNALPCVTGRVCPQEIQCEGRCVRAKKGASVAIGSLERFVADWAMAHPDRSKPDAPTTSGRSVAIVGSGPAGLTAAGELVKQGHDVTVFEAFHAAGGVLIYGIPEFRLPKDIVQQEVDRLVATGVKIETNAIIGRTYTLRELRDRFDSVFLAVGAGLPVFMNVPGENLKGVYSANEYLTRVNLMGAWNPESDTPVLRGHRVVVVGGGNVAMDSVRTAKRLGADEATIVYRRGMAELPARAEEVHHAEQEGIRFELQVAPLEVLGDENRWVTGIRCIRMELGEPDASGRRRPTPIAGSEFVIELRDGRGGDRHALEPAPHRVGAGPGAQQGGLHRHRRARHVVATGRLRRRRHRARGGHGDPGDGRRQARRRLHRRLAARRVPAPGRGGADDASHRCPQHEPPRTDPARPAGARRSPAPPRPPPATGRAVAPRPAGR